MVNAVRFLAHSVPQLYDGKKMNKKYPIIALLSLLILLPIAASESSKRTEKTISLMIDGLVASPGKYELPEGSKVHDLIKAAGGIKRLGRKEKAILISGTRDTLLFHILDLTKEKDDYHNRFLHEGDKLYVELRHH